MAMDPLEVVRWLGGRPTKMFDFSDPCRGTMAIVGEEGLRVLKGDLPEVMALTFRRVEKHVNDHPQHPWILLELGLGLPLVVCLAPQMFRTDCPGLTTDIAFVFESWHRMPGLASSRICLQGCALNK
jgi:hypothetical protein